MGIYRAMLETLLREMDEEGIADDSGETVVHDNDQARAQPNHDV